MSTISPVPSTVAPVMPDPLQLRPIAFRTISRLLRHFVHVQSMVLVPLRK